MRGEEILKSRSTPTLTTLDWDVYNAIKAASEYGYPITQKDLCDAVGLDYRPDSRGNGNRNLWDIVRKINHSYEVDKWIFTDDYTYILADENQYKKLMAYYTDRLKKAVEDLNILKQKSANDGQGKILTNQLKLMTPQAKEFHEAYREEAK